MRRIPVLVIGLFLVLSGSPLHADDITSDAELEHFRSMVSMSPFATTWMPDVERLELKLLQTHMSFLPLGIPDFTDTYTKGMQFMGPAGTMLGYIATGGMYEGTYWKFAFSADLTPAQRLVLLKMTTRYIQSKLTVLEAEWAESQLDPAKARESLFLKVDFLAPDSFAKRWLLDMFGSYPKLVLEDSAKQTEFSVSELRKTTPNPRPGGEVGLPGNVIEGFQFGNAYSPNLKKMASLATDGSVIVADTRTGKVIATVSAPEVGTPKVQLTSTQLVLDYGPGKKRYHYGVAEFTLLYTVDNWQAPARSSGASAGMCRAIFVL